MKTKATKKLKLRVECLRLHIGPYVLDHDTLLEVFEKAALILASKAEYAKDARTARVIRKAIAATIAHDEFDF